MNSIQDTSIIMRTILSLSEGNDTTSKNRDWNILACLLFKEYAVYTTKKDHHLNSIFPSLPKYAINKWP